MAKDKVLQKNVRISVKMFNENIIPLIEDTHRYLILYGGAGSGKSHGVAQFLLFRLLKNKGANLLCVRKTARSNRVSTYPILRKVIAQWGMQDEFDIRESDMRIKLLNGNEVQFAGLDDVEKLKSITFESGLLTYIWVEEATEITQKDFEQLNLRLRGETKYPYQIIFSFNPILITHWIKKYFFDNPNKKTKIVHSTYRDNRFLDDDYKEELEGLKEKSPTMYDVYALGKWGTLEDVVYPNYRVKDFEDEFESHYRGIDWGYNDPFAYVKVAFHDQTIYICDELYEQKMTDDELMPMLIEKGVSKSVPMVADSSEPKSIKHWRNSGWNIRPAVKGPDSVRFGIKWIQQFPIVIHPECQNFLAEIQGYSWRVDKDDHTLEEPVDFNNHLMDAMRYALEPKMHERRLKARARI